ncbi:MAG: hypothetical protein IKC27_09050 [Kiritimatiellae bacterium]|nr:hypothetical protein [Kiritimatiellia bacterium]
MCDKQHYHQLENRVEKLEKDYSTHAAVSNEQIKTLFNAVNRLFWITVIFSGLLLLTVIYGAIGERGFNRVTETAQEMAK